METSMERNLNIDSWRIFRILSEFVDGFETMTDIGPSVSIFGSSRISENHPTYQIAVELGRKIASKGFAVITGGGPGVMEGANKGAWESKKGHSCGINIDLPFEPDSNPYIERKYRLSFRYYFVRKVMLVRYAQAFIFLPGGLGTLDELFEALTLIQTKKIRPFPIYLVGTSYWQGLLNWLKNDAIKEGFLHEGDLSLFTITDNLDEIVEGIVAHYRACGSVPTFDLGIEQDQIKKTI